MIRTRKLALGQQYWLRCRQTLPKWVDFSAGAFAIWGSSLGFQVAFSSHVCLMPPLQPILIFVVYHLDTSGKYRPLIGEYCIPLLGLNTLLCWQEYHRSNADPSPVSSRCKRSCLSEWWLGQGGLLLSPSEVTVFPLEVDTILQILQDCTNILFLFIFASISEPYLQPILW